MDEHLDRVTNPGNNHYIDTRSFNYGDSNTYGDSTTEHTVSFTKAVIDGLAPTGGLYVPEAIPHLELDEIVALARLPYWERAARIYKAFNIDLDDAAIDVLMRKSYGDNFDNEEICPITKLDDDTFILELWHGPTSAFKDMALQCLPNFFGASAEKLRAEGELNSNFCILVATSGDTGKAALEGFRGVDGISVGVLFPDQGVSDIQRKQMVTTIGDNVCVWAVRGNFDDCQKAVKHVFSDNEFAELLATNYKEALSSANSINWGRLLPQIVYYISSYAVMVDEGDITVGDPIDICVPTGNFGNILAAWYAKRIGVPIETLICASNENCVLTDFINTGTYDISDREFVTTPSPSMDILVSSNLERQLFELTGRNGDAISKWMQSLNDDRKFQVDKDTFAKMRLDFKSDSVTNDECLETIRELFEDSDYLIDPHTAVAYAAAMRLRSDNPVLIASTAHWAKFGNNVYKALHAIPADGMLPDDVAKLTGCELNQLIANETGKHDIPKGLANLDSMQARFDTVIDGNIHNVEDAVVDFIKTQGN